jgi:hypothetical protein
VRRLWLCAVHRREQGSDGDAYAWFAKLHAAGELGRTFALASNTVCVGA